MRTGLRTGLLGGSFNPAHGGHRRITLFAMEALALDEAWWMVSPGNPLKTQAGMAPLAARMISARAQARRAPIRVTAIERDMGTRYTIDTLRHLKRRYPKRDFIWLMGSDNLAQFHLWRDWRYLLGVGVETVPNRSLRSSSVSSSSASWSELAITTSSPTATITRSSSGTVLSPSAWT